MWTDQEWFFHQLTVRTVIDHQLRGDLQRLVLNRELFTLYSNSCGRTDSIVFDKLNKPRRPSLISRPPVSIKRPLECV